MEEVPNKTYTISEIATLLSVPRTTLSDWLNKYSRFLQTETKGKRKVYTASAFEMLKEIARLRDENYQLIDIEKFLEDKYGFHAQVVSDDKVTIEKDVEVSSSKKPKVNKNDELSLTVKNQYDEILKELAIVTNERNRSVKKGVYLIVSIVVLILVAIAVFGIASLKMLHLLDEKSQQDIKSLQQQNVESNSFILEKFNENKSKTEAMEAQNSSNVQALAEKMETQNNQLQGDLEKQKAELKELIAELKGKVSSKEELVSIKEREEFARQQKELLEKLLAKEQEISTLNEKITSQNSQLIEIQKELKAIKDMNSEKAADEGAE